MTELRAALERHRPCEEDHGDSECGLCEYCEDDWPCLPARALAEIERLEKALRELVGAWQALRLLQGGEHTLEDSMRAYGRVELAARAAILPAQSPDATP